MKSLLIVEAGLIDRSAGDFLYSEGFCVDFLKFQLSPPFEYKGFKNRCLNIFNRLFFNNKQFIYQLENNFKSKYYDRIFNDFFNNKKQYDYILLVRPENFSESALKKFRKKGKKVIGYYWDEISSKSLKNLVKIRPYFDGFFSFNMSDVQKYEQLRMKYETNFYYPIKFVPAKQKLLSYVGNYTGRRLDFIDKVIDNCSKEYITKFNIKLVIRDSPEYFINQNVEILNDVPYLEHLKYTAEALLTLDIKPNINDGISFRVFEAAYHQTKIITDNSYVKKLRFYHPDNILVIENELSFKLIKDFLSRPYVPVKSEILEHYRMDNWIRRIFED